MRKKISISIDDSLLKKIDSEIDEENRRNRSQVFENIVRKHFSKKEVSQAIILLGKDTPKKQKLVQMIRKLGKIGFSDIIIAAGKSNEKLADHLGNGSDLAVRIHYIYEPKLLGTAGVIRSAENYISGKFLVIAGDTEFNLDIENLIGYHTKRKNPVTMGITAVNLKQSTDNIILEGDKIIHFDYNTKTKSNITNAGIYMFNKEIIGILPKKGSLEKEIFPKLADQGRLYSYTFNKMWKHIT